MPWKDSLYATCDRMVVLRIVSPEEAEIVCDGDGRPAWDEAGLMGSNGQRRISIKRLAAIAARQSTLQSMASDPCRGGWRRH